MTAKQVEKRDGREIKQEKDTLKTDKGKRSQNSILRTPGLDIFSGWNGN